MSAKRVYGRSNRWSHTRWIIDPSCSTKFKKRNSKKISNIKNGNDEVIEVTKENTEKLIKKTKESIEDGFQKLSDIIKTNTQINEPDVITKK